MENIAHLADSQVLIQTSSESIPSTPFWFGEVAVIARFLQQVGVLATIEERVRIIPCWLPMKSPWLNRIEPKWVHGKRAIVEPSRLLTAQELKQRVCDYFGCEQAELLTQRSRNQI